MKPKDDNRKKYVIKKRKKLRIKSLEKNRDSLLVLYKSCDSIDSKRILIMLKNIRIATKINKRKKEREERILSEKREKKKRDYLEHRQKIYEEHQRLSEIKKVREEKERKEFEEMRKRYFESKLLNMKLREQKMLERKQRHESMINFFKKKEEESRKFILERKLKLMEDKKRIEEERNLYLEKQKQKLNEEHEKMIEKINIIKNKYNELEEIKKREENFTYKEKIESKLNRIESKCHLFLRGELNDLIEKLEFIDELEKFIMDEISYNYNYKTHNLLSPSEAVFYNNNDYIMKLLGFLGSELSLNKINNVYIEKKPTNELIRDVSFKIITSGQATQTIYKISLESQKKKNDFKKDYEQWFKFNDLLRDKINESFNVPKDDIYFFNYDFENIESYFIIYNRNLSGIPLFLKSLGLRTSIKPLLNYVILSPINFELEYCKKPQDWPEGNLKRGGEKYFPPYEYYGLALKLRGKYNDTGDNGVWFGKLGDREGEWPVAYHGIGRGNEFLKVLSIIDDNLKEGPRQIMKNRISKANKNDFPLCNQGVYLTPEIEEAEKYATKVTLGNFKKKFQFIFMSRVNPKKIREPGTVPVNWILNGNDEEIRPYRLLIKIT